ncbi:metal-dependent hydrolase [Cohnella lubricantis]|uniref:Metal-dependent hydrolase n=1 Tax=Cohnella lubricantis TaxID=2163172 RepID=A0A841TH42_9BACL|nr:metal-dependent hydrolase [Cohnella lubricantis]MBB6678267.1 metal-dependent hydrolase [Cohnella lubricantis]MBP2118468.1 inner membrane protein [Cohnella lubricantis]
MDSGTHLMFGLGLGGLALADPAIATHPDGPVAILIGTILGSQAPDADMLLRFKSNADYIRNHRGWSHSIPAQIGWAALITLAVSLLFRGVPWGHLAAWILLAVVLHVTTDLFNSYGTQGFRPFTKKWIAFSSIHVFDPAIFASHALAVLLWLSGLADPRAIFPVLYAFVVLYIAWRTWVHRRLLSQLPKKDPDWREGDRYKLLSTLSMFRWNVVKLSQDNRYSIGEWENSTLRWVDRTRCDDHPAIEASKSSKDVQALLNLTPCPCGHVRIYSWGYEVRWEDIRYRYRRQYPFVAVVLMDANYVPLQSYVGWLSDDRLEKRLRMNTY